MRHLAPLTVWVVLFLIAGMLHGCSIPLRDATTVAECLMRDNTSNPC